jgi:hypothetical protein
MIDTGMPFEAKSGSAPGSYSATYGVSNNDTVILEMVAF